MVWLTVDENGTERAHEERPYRDIGYRGDIGYWDSLGNYIVLPDGSIEKLIYRKLTWDDDPVELELHGIGW